VTDANRLQGALSKGSAIRDHLGSVAREPEESVKAGVKEGLWVEESFGSIVLADAGRRYFTQASGLPTYSVVLAQPAGVKSSMSPALSMFRTQGI